MICKYFSPSRQLIALAMVVASLSAHAQKNFDPLEMQQARIKSVTSKGHKVWYTKTFDLSALPDYVPQQQVSGTIRQWGNNYLADSTLGKQWEEAFKKLHPGIDFKNNLTSSVNAFPGLISGTADIGQMGRAALWDELQGYQRQFASKPLELTIATGSFNVPGWTFALGVFVHKDNPLAKLTLQQLDGIFGAQRTGGWKGLEWDTSVARGPEKNIRTWGQLGLTGEWADKPIRVYGYTPQFHFPDEISKKVLGGSTKWNEQIKEYVNAARPDGTLALAGDLFMADLANDKYGIAYTGIAHSTPGSHGIALATDAGAPGVALTIENVQNRSYPLIRDVYAYVRAEKPMDPKVKEFMRFVLSKQGQEMVMKDGKYLPLTAAAVREQLAKLK
jgi:phosphate transport system substrate-binding protein